MRQYYDRGLRNYTFSFQYMSAQLMDTERADQPTIALVRNPLLLAVIYVRLASVLRYKRTSGTPVRDPSVCWCAGLHLGFIRWRSSAGGQRSFIVATAVRLKPDANAPGRGGLHLRARNAL